MSPVRGGAALRSLTARQQRRRASIAHRQPCRRWSTSAFTGLAAAVVLALPWVLELVEEGLFARGESWHSPPGVHAVVVLGYALDDNCTPTPLLAQRVAAGVSLATELQAALVFSGGVPPPRASSAFAPASSAARPRCLSEAAEMASHARKLDPNAMRTVRAVYTEAASRNTRENALFSFALLRRAEPRLQALHVVTNRFHQQRACAAFDLAAAEEGMTSLSLRCAPVPSSLQANWRAPADSRWLDSTMALVVACAYVSLHMAMEAGAMVKYKALGWI